MKYVTKHRIVDAVKITADMVAGREQFPDWASAELGKSLAIAFPGTLRLWFDDGRFKYIDEGHYLLRDSEGKLSSCGPAEFLENFEPFEDHIPDTTVATMAVHDPDSE